MASNEFWSAMSRSQRVGFFFGLVLIIAMTAAVGAWAMKDPWIAIATDISADRVVALTKELAKEKVEHRVTEDGATVEVHQSNAGRARAAAATGGVGLPTNVGLEIFKETDFSSTDFAQRINYQRALQGELTRTLQAIAGVRQARVHVILADNGVLKRGSSRASAAVTLALAPGKSLTRTQVHGIQRLVASSVPDIKLEDIVVIDESGNSLVRDASDNELSSTQLDLKRQVDSYFEAKLLKLLEELAPGVQPTLSVDTVLDYKHLRVTVDEPLAARGPADSERAVGVVTKERESRRSTPVNTGTDTSTNGHSTAAAATTETIDTNDVETEYKVGHRLEQSSLGPGTIRRVSVAVALQGAPADLTSASVEALVSHAVGLDRKRGDSVMVLMLARTGANAMKPLPPPLPDLTGKDAPSAGPTSSQGLRAANGNEHVIYAVLLGGIGIAALVAVLLIQRQRAERRRLAQLDNVVTQVQMWMDEGPHHARD